MKWIRIITLTIIMICHDTNCPILSINPISAKTNTQKSSKSLSYFRATLRSLNLFFESSISFIFFYNLLLLVNFLIFALYFNSSNFYFGNLYSSSIKSDFMTTISYLVSTLGREHSWPLKHSSPQYYKRHLGHLYFLFLLLHI